MDAFLQDVLHELRRHRGLVERAMGPLDEAQFFARPAPHVNSVAVIVKHLAGNLVSRWTDFLTSDGEKPSRDRDGEFVLTAQDTRPRLMDQWNRGWDAVIGAVEGLTTADLDKTVTIRGEGHTARQALLRGLTHVAYHAGQILYIARIVRPEGEWLTIAPGKSREHAAGYRK
jgi:hypothetical protein